MNFVPEFYIRDESERKETLLSSYYNYHNLSSQEMCGIGLLLTLPDAGDQSSCDIISQLNQELSEALSSRGPDLPCGMQRQNIRRGHDIQDLTLHASVLHMQGTLPTPQPLLFNNDCVLCWNGECYSFNDTQEQNMVELTATEMTEESDTGLLANMLQDALNKSNGSSNHHNAIADVMSRIHGEYAFIIFVPSTSDNSPSCIYYGRDPLGRRSLLINKSIHGGVILSSVSISTNSYMLTARDDGNVNAQEWIEIPPGSVHRLDVETGSIESKEISQIIIRAIPRIIESSKDSTDATDFMQLLDKAVERRVAHVPSSHSSSDVASVAILFSGGIDSVVLAALSHRHVPTHQPLDLINVSFFDDSNGNNSLTHSPDRQAAILSYIEMQSLFPERTWRFIAVDVKYDEVLHHEDHIRRLLHPLRSTMDFNIATAFWFSARSQGRLLDSMEIEEVQRELKASEESMNNDSKEFSSHQPLLRFASKSDRSNSTVARNTQACIREGCSRRSQSGCIFQSCKFCCGKFQGPISSFLGKSARICPTHNQKQCTKGKGNESTTPRTKNEKKKTAQPLENHVITSSAKVLISGVGADEQLAGYGRHRTTFQRGGYDALAEELKMEVNRLWKRNLGRDDRCLSDHGKEARFPFLDDSVVQYLAKLPIDRKCDMAEAPGVGDKRLLREVARIIGVHSCSTLVKRAIQFGSRIAKVSDRSRFGSCRQASGTAAIRNAKE